jgi:hypothetical protein
MKSPETFNGSSIFKIFGPTAVAFKELQFGFASAKRILKAIEFSNVDQPNSNAEFDQIYSACDTTIMIDRLNYIKVEHKNSFFSDRTIIRGGALQQQGKGSLFFHSFGGQYAGIEVYNGGQFVAKDCWWEGPNSIPLNLKGDGNITIDGAKIAPNKGDSTAIIKVNQFRGKLLLANMYIQGGIEIIPNNPDLKILLWNANFYYKKDIAGIVPPSFNGKLAFMGITTQCFYKNDPDCSIIKSVPNIFRNLENNNQFIKEMMEDDRKAIPGIANKRNKDASSIYFSRVSFDSFATAISFKN